MAIAVTVPEHLKKKPVKVETEDKRKGWSTPYGFIDFKQPETYETACAEMKPLYERFLKQNKEGV